MFQLHRVNYETFNGKQGIESQNQSRKHDLSEVKEKLYLRYVPAEKYYQSRS